MLECKNDIHNTNCCMRFTANICESYSPVRTEDYKLIDEMNGLELYEYSGPYIPNKQFKVKISEFVECTIYIPYDIVTEKEASEILSKIMNIAEGIKNDLNENSPELIIG